MESNKTACKVCKLVKDRILDGKYPDSKNKRYKDENGKYWNGKTCPECQKNKTKDNMKKLRFRRAIEEKVKPSGNTAE